MPPPQGTQNPLEGPGDYTMTKDVHNDTYAAIDPIKTANLSGRSVMIVGSSKGLGKSMALSFAKAGASQIALAARSDLSAVEAEVKAAAMQAGRPEPKVLKVKLDITDQASNEQAAKTVAEAFDGKLDILINNAGILDGMALIGDSDPELWWKTMTANVKGPYLTTRSFIPLLLKSELKTLINLSSVGAHCVNPTGSPYQISKLAVLRLTEFTSVEYADPGLIAFSVHPGNILTDIVGNGEGMTPEFKALFTERPELCADSLVFLAKERREWLGGRYVNCTWDLPELCSEAKVKEIVEGGKLKMKLVV